MNVATCVSMKSFTVPKAAQSDSWALKADFSEQVETSAEKQSWHPCTHSTVEITSQRLNSTLNKNGLFEKTNRERGDLFMCLLEKSVH